MENKVIDNKKHLNLNEYFNMFLMVFFGTAIMYYILYMINLISYLNYGSVIVLDIAFIYVGKNYADATYKELLIVVPIFVTITFILAYIGFL